MVTPLDQRPRSGPYSGLTARSAKRFLTQTFQDAGLPYAEEDAVEIILAATGLDRTSLVLRGTFPLEAAIIDIITQNMARRLAGEPVDHILGWRDFFGRQFKISKDVLSPRADTETLIRGALVRLEKTPRPRLLDLGTGSGAIGLTLLAERPDATLLATDLSEDALKIAKENAASLNVEERAQFAQGAWWEAVPQQVQYDMILSNPPYITSAAMLALEPEVIGYDPDLALRGGEDGLDGYRAIISNASRHLKTDGWLGFEIGFDQADALSSLLSDHPWARTTVEKDLSRHDRAVWTQKSE